MKGRSALLVGVDLAWGDKKPDGVCFIEATRRKAVVAGYAYPRGDDELMQVLGPFLDLPRDILITIDAPIVCPNITGTRPVDRLTHRMFHREHAACHPANLTKCPRPPRVLRRLNKLGFKAGWEVRRGMKTAAEVYPHPAMVRMFRLDRIVKYKKGTVVERRKEFSRLQRLMKRSMRELFPTLTVNGKTKELLNAQWTKPIEDSVDALFCAMLGLWHWQHEGKRSEVIGNKRTGFILLPEDLRNGKRIR